MLSSVYLVFLSLILFINCGKNKTADLQRLPCLVSAIAPQRYYLNTDLQEIEYDNSHCGYLSLNKMNYWIYLDSIFDNNGLFQYSQVDTLRFTRTFRTPDGLIWWKPNLSIGFLSYNYATDSMLYTLGVNWSARPAVPWYYPIASDSSVELVAMSDVNTLYIAKKIQGNVVVPAGSFQNCVNYIKKFVLGSGTHQEAIYKPHLGVLRFRLFYSGDLQNPEITRQTSTLLAFHLE
jgi:hypothetical protein